MSRRGGSEPPYRRGDLVWANLEPTLGHEQAGRRPVVILSNDPFNARSGTVICMPMTTQKPRAGEPFTLEVAHHTPSSWVKISQVRTLSTERLDSVINNYGPEVADRCMELLGVICSRQVTGR